MTHARGSGRVVAPLVLVLLALAAGIAQARTLAVLLLMAGLGPPAAALQAAADTGPAAPACLADGWHAYAPGDPLEKWAVRDSPVPAAEDAVRTAAGGGASAVRAERVAVRMVQPGEARVVVAARFPGGGARRFAVDLRGGSGGSWVSVDAPPSSSWSAPGGSAAGPSRGSRRSTAPPSPCRAAPPPRRGSGPARRSPSPW